MSIYVSIYKYTHKICVYIHIYKTKCEYKIMKYLFIFVFLDDTQICLEIIRFQSMAIPKQ